jgi:hypothetical protein
MDYVYRKIKIPIHHDPESDFFTTVIDALETDQDDLNVVLDTLQRKTITKIAKVDYPAIFSIKKRFFE